MVFMLICLAGLIFVALALPGALRRRGGSNCNPHVSNDKETNIPYWQKNNSHLTADRLEYHELWEKHNDDPMNFPPPIPPTKPHPYFGNEAERKTD